MWRIAREPRFRWFGRWSTPDVGKKVADYLSCAAALQPGAVPLIVVMRHQGKECGASYTAGGRAEDLRTMRWYERFAAGVGNARVIIGFEPDSLGTLDCLARSRRAARLRVLRHGVDVLTRLPAPRSTSRRAHPTGSPRRAPLASSGRSGSTRRAASC